MKNQFVLLHILFFFCSEQGCLWLGLVFFFKVVIDVARYKLLRWNFENLFFVYFLSPIIYHLLVFVLFLSFFFFSLRTKKYITLKFQNAQPMWKFLYNGREQWMKQKSKKSWPIFHLFCLFVCCSVALQKICLFWFFFKDISCPKYKKFVWWLVVSAMNWQLASKKQL